MFAYKVVIVTGACSGIGAVTAKLFAKNGAKLTLVGLNKDNLEQTAESCLKESKVKAQTIIADLSVEEQARTVVPLATQHWGSLDVLVNNAGKAKSDSILKNDYIATLRDVVNTNLFSAAILTNDAAPHLVKSRGNIINISSVAALKPIAESFSYSISKSALDQLTKCSALELAPKGVRVNSINPGPVKTNITANSFGFTAEQSEEYYSRFLKVLPLHRLIEREEIGDLVMYLASDKARSITGGTFVIDAGSMVMPS